MEAMEQFLQMGNPFAAWLPPQPGQQDGRQFAAPAVPPWLGPPLPAEPARGPQPAAQSPQAAQAAVSIAAPSQPAGPAGNPQAAEGFEFVDGDNVDDFEDDEQLRRSLISTIKVKEENNDDDGGRRGDEAGEEDEASEEDDAGEEDEAGEGDEGAEAGERDKGDAEGDKGDAEGAEAGEGDKGGAEGDEGDASTRREETVTGMEPDPEDAVDLTDEGDGLFVKTESSDPQEPGGSEEEGQAASAATEPSTISR